MRIQHNIPAMSSYRNYSNNTSALSKNLEKLSSGYKINRAGDDAAGLAISEKMRIQITGLEVAQKNAKDGISLIQTAEGALTEVHDMLNRMYELAEQSANGTYADEVDREQLQKEVDSLRTEIDRIADSSNFNGINLLDGSLATDGSGPAVKPGEITGIEAHTVEATKGKSDLTLADVTANTKYADGDTVTFSLGLSDGSSEEITLTAKVDKDNNTQLVGADGKVYKEIAATTDDPAQIAAVSNADLAEALAAALKSSDLGESFSITRDGAKITMEAKKAGENVPYVSSFGESSIKAAYTGGTNKAKIEATKGENDITALDFLEDMAPKAYPSGATVKKPEDSIFEINGVKFALTDNSSVDSTLFGDDVHVFSLSADGGTTTDSVAQFLSNYSGLDITYTTDTNVKLENGAAAGTGLEGFFLIKGKTSGTGSSGGLKLQIGDTAEDFNQLTVGINDCHAEAMGIGAIDISTQKGAAKAMAKIKEATNYVSDVRGTLGALQNRLDHTINNLSVMQENIQDAESTIRDVDVAKEMTEYTKNNILVQSAQAMLAQANQLPQGVLQLLQ